MLVRAYQVRGHHLANLDPLDTFTPKQYDMPPPPETTLEYYGFTDRDLDREFFVGTGVLSGFLSSATGVKTLREILSNLRLAYCGTIGVEYMHIANRDQCNWLRERFEKIPDPIPREERIQILDSLTWATRFEEYLDKKHQSVKRFGLDGCESLIPGMNSIGRLGHRPGNRACGARSLPPLFMLICCRARRSLTPRCR